MKKPAWFFKSAIAICALSIGLSHGKAADVLPKVSMPPIKPKLWVSRDEASIERPQLERTTSHDRSPSAAYDAALVRDWVEIELVILQSHRLSPPRAARALALVTAAISDALVISIDRRIEGYEIDDALTAAYAVKEVVSYLHPDFAKQVAIRANNIERNLSGGETQVLIGNSKKAGESVGRSIVAFAQEDGADSQPEVKVPPADVSVWSPIAEGQSKPAEPGWGWVRPIAISLDALATAAAPPDWSSDRFKEERRDFIKVQSRLGPDDRALALKWAGDPGTPTPAGLWFVAALELTRSYSWTPLEAARVFSTLGVAMHNTFITCWRAKYTYFVPRPLQWMALEEPTWHPFLKTPMFPSFPSGHAAISGAASRALREVVPDIGSQVAQYAEDAAYSRVVGGIHWNIDSSLGLELGDRVAGQIITYQKDAR